MYPWVWVIAVSLIGLLLMIRWSYRDRRGQRGFEVKVATGGEPVMKQKEDDHG
jgi:hypothetical protein